MPARMTSPTFVGRRVEWSRLEPSLVLTGGCLELSEAALPYAPVYWALAPGSDFTLV